MLTVADSGSVIGASLWEVGLGCLLAFAAWAGLRWLTRQPAAWWRAQWRTITGREPLCGHCGRATVHGTGDVCPRCRLEMWV